MWLTGRLAPDFKTIADFRKDNGAAIRSACRQFVALCRKLNLFTQAMVAIDGSRFKAVNSRDRSFSRGSIERRMDRVEASIERLWSALETADRRDGELAEAKSAWLKDKIASLRKQPCPFDRSNAKLMCGARPKSAGAKPFRGTRLEVSEERS